jgi:hypothetical protein
LTPRLVRFTSTAQEHVRREKDWWVENRTHTDIFATELEQALKVLTVLPGSWRHFGDGEELDEMEVEMTTALAVPVSSP